MTYEQFLNTFVDPIQAFFSWATTITSNLLTNYVFITIVGLSVISTLIYFFVDYFVNFENKSSSKKNLDNGGKR